MKKYIYIIGLMLISASSIIAQEKDIASRNLSDLTGPYLGQGLPDLKPKVFAPGIVSNGRNASSPVISPDGTEIYWDVDKIWYTTLKDGRWTIPEMVSFCAEDEYLYRVPCVSPDGRKIYFLSTRPGSVSQDKENIWYVDRISKGWSHPVPISSKVNALRIHWNISISNSGTIYFQGNRIDIHEQSGIYFSKMQNGEYVEPVKMGPEINALGTMTTCPYIAPDESYIIFNRMGNTPENSGIFISFRNRKGKWQPATLLVGGSREKGGLSPRISPDGKYLFYVNGHVYWMSIAQIIEDLKFGTGEI